VELLDGLKAVAGAIHRGNKELPGHEESGREVIGLHLVAVTAEQTSAGVGG
jgi:hypothetical protein